MGGGTTADSGFAIPVHGATGWKGLLENKRALGLATFASLGGVLYGYNQGVFAQVQVASDFTRRFPTVDETNPQFYDANVKSFLTSILELTAFVGALATGPLADRFSRKYSISGWCIIFILGTALQTAATSTLNMVWAGRAVAGLAVGALSALVPMYNSELASPGIRGSLVALQQLAITFGILVSYWIAYGTSYIGGHGEGQTSAAWRIPLGLQILPAFVLMVGAVFLPFSPRWLMLRGREEERLLTLAKLRQLDPEHIAVQSEYMSLQAEQLVEQDAMQERYGDEAGWKVGTKEYLRLFRSWPLLQRLLLGIAAQSLQQWTGINAIIFRQVGLEGDTIPILATGIVGVINLVFTIPAVMFVDNMGRKKMLFLGATGMAICHAIVAGIIARAGPDFENKAAGTTAVVFLYLFIAIFAVSWGPLAWVVCAEVFPLSLRAKGMSISSGVNWLQNFAVASVTPVMIKNIGYKTYIVFMCFMIFAMFWSAIILPELRGLSPQQIDEVFHDTTSTEDEIRREKIARQIGLDKLHAQAEVEHQEDAPGDKLV
ncbi:hypothetical protein QFC21_003938 [Naganishia friedmannii]|uniref:Uncharacterized protein n=1 Tax=Naganishia friedmannii TaxID=89922 RepID=A0ACC2VLK5_9TREE|nr:hypothetical protein QFC21_003938 [Naganishia friedmannii]